MSPERESATGAVAAVPSAATAVAAVAWRELQAYVHAPIAYVAGVLFLVLQGFSFWALASVLADPGRPAPVGAVLHQHFGGTFLYWTVLLAYVALLSMRLVAEDRRQGTWELLCTAPVPVEAVLVGKWLGALGFYLALWVPTGLYVVLVSVYAPVAVDLGPVLTAYLGVALTGAAFLAVGLAASAATGNQIVAAALAFAALLVLFLLGQVPELVPDWVAAHPALAVALAHIDVRGHMDTLARGELSLAAVAFFVGLGAAGLALAQRAAVSARRGPGERRRRTLACAFVIVIAAGTNLLAARHPVSWDASAARSNSLEPRTREILAAVDQPVDVVVIAAGLAAFAPVQDEIDRLLGRMVAAQPRLRVERLDPALAPARAEALAAELALPAQTLAEGGAVVFRLGPRRRAVDLLDMAGFEADELGAGRLSRFRAEAAFAAALAELVELDRPTLCYSRGHGELALRDPADPARDDDRGPDDDRAEGDGYRAGEGGAAAAGEVALAGPAPGSPHWAGIAARVERDGGRLRALPSLDAGVPADCRVLVIAGPTRPLRPRAVRAVDAYLAGGGRLLLALSAGIDPAQTPPRVPETGLALVLARYGIELVSAVVADPQNPIDSALAWLTVSGYGDHPIVSSFADRRFTTWLAPRALRLVQPAEDHIEVTALVSSSAAGWAETDLTSVVLGRPARDANDPAGPVVVAAAAEDRAGGARLVVFGSALSLSSASPAADGNQLLTAAALAWLGGRDQVVDIDAKTPEQVRLILSQAQRVHIFALCVLALPALLAVVGALLWWRRRRG
ncbi:Gldg family protein [Haliangium sp.]|uniref:Gldg family protein n=1 Tax=Haliangium sp. TaxID=2663208 RepID=UPI003D0A534C